LSDLFGIGLEEEMSGKEESVRANPWKTIVVSQVKDESLNQGGKAVDVDHRWQNRQDLMTGNKEVGMCVIFY